MNLLESVFSAVLHTSWRASWLILGVVLLQAVFRRRLSARVIYWVSLAAVLRLLVPFAISGGWNPVPPVFPPAPQPAAWAAPRPEPPPSTERMVGPATVLLRSSRERGVTSTPAIAIAWLVGALLLIAFRLLAAVGFASRLRRSSRSAPIAVLAEVERQFGPRRIRVAITNLVSAPALHGIFRPRLLIPPDLLNQLSPAELRLIIAHERGHYVRRDLWAHELARLAVGVHWFNPLAWLAAHRLRRDCELACDALVLRGAARDDRIGYGETLLRTLSLTPGARTPRFGLGVVESRQQLQLRIRMIAQPRPVSLFRTVIVGTAASACAAISLSRSSQAQTSANPPVPATVAPALGSAAEHPSVDNLDQLFPDGVVAAVGNKTITVATVRRELAPLVSQVRREAKTPQEFQQRMRVLQNQVVQQLIGRELLIKEFHTPSAGPVPHIDPQWTDKAVADRIQQQFAGDQDKFEAYLRERGMTLADYRREVENDIIYSYMLAEERKLSPKRPGAPDHKGAVHLRIIELPRSGRSDDALLQQAADVLARFHHGVSFAELARQFSVDGRHARGGDWGWVKESEVMPRYWESIRGLAPGQVAAPIVLPEGCFLLYVEDRG